MKKQYKLELGKITELRTEFKIKEIKKKKEYQNDAQKKCFQQKHLQQPIFLRLCRKQFDSL